MKVWKLIVSSCIIVLAMLLMMYLRPAKIHKELPALIYSTDKKFEQHTTIAIEGTAYPSLTGKDKLIGKLTVDHDLQYEVKLEYNGDYYFYTLLNPHHPDKELETIGTVYVSKSVDLIWFMSKDINERYNIDGYVFGPAGNYTEAEKLIIQLMHH